MNNFFYTKKTGKDFTVNYRSTEFTWNPGSGEKLYTTQHEELISFSDCEMADKVAAMLNVAYRYGYNFAINTTKQKLVENITQALPKKFSENT
jgi:N-acetyl-anhydromuramyl-L-alanine amidase AmpD